MLKLRFVVVFLGFSAAVADAGTCWLNIADCPTRPTLEGMNRDSLATANYYPEYCISRGIQRAKTLFDYCKSQEPMTAVFMNGTVVMKSQSYSESPSVPAPAAAPAPAPTPAPSPAAGNISCTNIHGITGATHVIPVKWETTIGRLTTKAYGGFQAGEAVVFKLTIPTGAATYGKYANFRISPMDGYAYNDRTMAISERPCDLSRSLAPAAMMYGQETTVFFTVGGYAQDRYGRPITTYPDLQPGRTYFITVTHQNSQGSNTCQSGSCNVDFGLITQ